MKIDFKVPGFEFYLGGKRRQFVGVSLPTRVVFECTYQTLDNLRFYYDMCGSLAAVYSLYLSVNINYWFINTDEPILTLDEYFKIYKCNAVAKFFHDYNTQKKNIQRQY